MLMSMNSHCQDCPEKLIWIQLKDLAVSLKDIQRLVPKPLLHRFLLLGLFSCRKVTHGGGPESSVTLETANGNHVAMILGRW